MALSLYSVIQFISLTACTPDFTIDADLFSSHKISVEYIPEGDCQYNEGCVSGYGERILLRFDTGVANIGTSDFILGDPSTNPNTVYDPCHQHYHYTEWMEYKVFDVQDDTQQHTLIDGFKQGFCLMDSQQYDHYPGNKSAISPQAQYSCTHQGISVGWMDVYGEHLSCQYVDITDFDEGAYTLKAAVNPYNNIQELDTSNNEVSTTFEFDGDISSYYWSDYQTCRSDIKSWTSAFNSMLEEIEDFTDLDASILALFQFGASELCFNPGGCQTGVELLSGLYGFDAVLDVFKFKIDKSSIVYGTGYWFAKAEWTMHSISGCKFRKSDTLIHVYYNEDGIMERTKLTSLENNLLELFIVRVIYAAIGGTPFICQRGNEYAVITEHEESGLVTFNHETKDNSRRQIPEFGRVQQRFVREDEFKDEMYHIHELLEIIVVSMLLIAASLIIFVCYAWNNKKSVINYDKIENDKL